MQKNSTGIIYKFKFLLRKVKKKKNCKIQRMLYIILIFLTKFLQLSRKYFLWILKNKTDIKNLDEMNNFKFNITKVKTNEKEML